ncbi:hypothetical protein [Neolewinella agarilytica]|uniref:Lipoprotein n=1 Tax=Neolewinella agarilytica TaxID=478744 RepID=A0A1H8YUT3_9BACT|nr:hypothetical protein [Neolewinella agarilytica]SEP55975.1 hypothetical protein SAMN05444359_10116 [Neolewinella agarilytica]
MRRILLFLLVAVITAFLSSCLTIEEHTTIRRDGSGSQVTTIDMSKMFDNPLMMMAMEEELKKGKGEQEERIDSSFLVYEEFLPANPQWTDEERSLVLRTEGRMVMDLAAGESAMTMSFPFQDLAELEALKSLLASANQPASEEEGGAGGMMSGLAGKNFTTGTLVLKGKKLIRTSTVASSMDNPFEDEELGEEGMEMVKEMFSDAVMVYTMEFPGKVKKVKGFPGHEVVGNQVIQAFDFLELLDKPEIVDLGLSGEIKFKK